jgi:phage recombination protein Bet
MSNIAKIDPQKSVLVRFANNYGVDQDKMLTTLKNTCFKDPNITNEQMMALLIVAEQHKLNPFTKEIYAFPDRQNGIVPVVGVDGWSRIINERPTFDGMEFRQSENMVTMDDAKPCPEWIECSIFDTERSHPVTVREYLDEVYREPFKGKNNYSIKGPWQTHTKRMLRHKAMIQCARVAYGFSGIYDPDEAERVIDGEIVREQINPDPVDQDAINHAIATFDELIENDEINEETHERATAVWERLSNDERMAVDKAFNHEIPGHPHHKKYRSIIKEHLNYHPSQGEG